MQAHGGRYFLHMHHSADRWVLPPVVDFMNKFLDTCQTVIDQSMFCQKTSPQGGQGALSAKTLTRWLTNSRCIAQALRVQCDGSTRTSTGGGKQGRSHKCIHPVCTTQSRRQCASNESQICVLLRRQRCNDIVHLCRSWTSLQLTRTRTLKSSGKPRTTSKVGLRTHTRSRCPSKGDAQFVGPLGVRVCNRSGSTGATGNATQLASIGSISTEVALTLRVTSHVWCVRKWATRESNPSFHHSWKRCEFCFVLRVRETCSALKTPS